MGSSILGSLLIKIAGNTVELNKALAQSESSISSFQKTVSTTNKLLAGFGIGFGLSQIVGELKDGAIILRDFEKQMSTVKAITGATDAEFEKLKKSALDLGKSTKFTSKEVAELQTEFARLGFSTKEILDATEATINLSIATGENLAKSAEVAGNVIRGFGLNADQTKRIVDVMAQSFNDSALGLDNFAEAMKYVAPIAKQAGLSVEQTTALLGTLADAGIKGSMAGTSLRKIISDLGAESGDLSERIAKLAAKGLTGADAMSEVGRTAYASLLVLAENGKKTDSLTNSLNNAAGAAEKTAAIMGDNLAGDLDALSSAYEGLILSQQGATGTLREFVQAGTAILSSLSDQEKGLGKYVGTWLKLVSVVPRALGEIASFLNTVAGGDQTLEEVGKQLYLLNAVRDKAKQEGDTETEQKATLAIIEITNRYKLLKDAVDGSNKSNEQAAATTGAVNDKVGAQLGLIAQLEAQIKDLEEAKKAAFSVEAIDGFNNRIKDLKDQLDLLNSTGGLSSFGKQILNQQAGATQISPLTASDFDPANIKSSLGITPLPVPQLDPAQMTALQEQFKVIQDQYEQTGLIAYNQTDQMAKGFDLQIERQQAAADSAAQYGSIIGDAFGQAISGQQSFANAAKKLTGELLKTFLSRALGGIIASAATSGGPPPVAIALAAAGVAAISAMFNKIGGPSSSAGGGGLSSSSATNIEKVKPLGPSEQIILQGGEFRLKGDDLVVAIDRVNKTKRRTG